MSQRRCSWSVQSIPPGLVFGADNYSNSPELIPHWGLLGHVLISARLQ